MGWSLGWSGVECDEAVSTVGRGGVKFAPRSICRQTSKPPSPSVTGVTFRITNTVVQIVDSKILSLSMCLSRTE